MPGFKYAPKKAQNTFYLQINSCMLFKKINNKAEECWTNH